MTRYKMFAAASAMAIGLASQPAAAATFNWAPGYTNTGSTSDFDDATQTFAAVVANSLTFDTNSNAYYGSGYFHNHGGASQFTISAIINGVSTQIYSSGAVGNVDFPLAGIGTIAFAAGSVTGISLTASPYVGQAFHDFQQSQTFSLNAVAGVPEPSAWALMILGFGAVGASLRRRKQVAAFAF